MRSSTHGTFAFLSVCSNDTLHVGLRIDGTSCTSGSGSAAETIGCTFACAGSSLTLTFLAESKAVTKLLMSIVWFPVCTKAQAGTIWV